MDALLEPIVRSPRFPECVEELKRREALEAERRARFYSEMRPDPKVEQDYAAHGVGEYWIIESKAVAGLRLPSLANFREDENLRT